MRMLRRRTPYVYNGTGGGFNELIRVVLGGANETEELDALDELDRDAWDAFSKNFIKS